MIKNMNKCVFCKNIAIISRDKSDSIIFLIDCKKCGKYRMSDPLLLALSKNHFLEEEIKAIQWFLGCKNIDNDITLLTENNSDGNGVPISFVFQEYKIKKQNI